MGPTFSRKQWIASMMGGLLLARRASAAPPQDRSPIDRMLPDETTRLALTQRYLDAHLPLQRVGTVNPARMVPEVVVLHWTGSGSAEGAFQTFSPARLGGRPELQSAGAVNVSAHFIVHRDGTCWRLLDERRVARHAIGLNHCSVGIENVGDGPLGGDSRAPLTQEQVTRNGALIRDLVRRHPTIGWLIGHHEYRRMESTHLFLERDPAYRTVKRDPGAAFMAAVRTEVADLGLLAPP